MYFIDVCVRCYLLNVKHFRLYTETQKKSSVISGPQDWTVSFGTFFYFLRGVSYKQKIHWHALLGSFNNFFLTFLKCNVNSIGFLSDFLFRHLDFLQLQSSIAFARNMLDNAQWAQIKGLDFSFHSMSVHKCLRLIIHGVCHVNQKEFSFNKVYVNVEYYMYWTSPYQTPTHFVRWKLEPIPLICALEALSSALAHTMLDCS